MRSMPRGTPPGRVVPAAMLFVGVDLSARRGFDVAVLDDERRVCELWRAATLDLLSAGLAAYAVPRASPMLIVAVDAPQAPSDFPLRRVEVRAGLPVPHSHQGKDDPGALLWHDKEVQDLVESKEAPE